MNLLRKLYAGDDIRKTRLHTESGDYIGHAQLLGLLPAAATWVRQALTGRYLVKPWWAWGAIARVGELLRVGDRVLEAGSGYSSLWLGLRCRSVCAIEEYEDWIRRIEALARERGADNISFRSGDSLEVFSQCLARGRFEVVVIDSPGQRLDMFRRVLALEGPRRPRLVIFDDTDKAENRPAFDCSAPDYRVETFRGFKPQTLHAAETSVFIRTGTPGPAQK